MPIQQGLVPRDTPLDRTEGKDEAFEALEELREEGRFHGRNLTDVADEIGWSRQHLSNVLRDYYTEAGSTDIVPAEGGGSGLHVRFDIDIPDDIDDKEAFLRGYVQGYMRGRE